MEKEYYIDHVKNTHSLYAKLEELANISGLPIIVEDSNIKYGQSDMKKDASTYYYKNDAKTIFIFFHKSSVTLAIIEGNSAEIYDADLEHVNSFKYYAYQHGISTELQFAPKKLSMAISNNLTKKFKELLDSLDIKVHHNRNKEVEYCSLDFTLPKLIEEEKHISEPILYIPECKVTIINHSLGRTYASTKRNGSVFYQEEGLKVTPSLFKSDILEHFSVTNLEDDITVKIMNPHNTSDITTLLHPIRRPEIKHIMEKIIFNANHSNLSKYLLRYYDEIIYALDYFQNEDLKLSYVFEDDLKRLQLK